ncbi:alanine racemase domain-containingprotein [Purpureocillium lavendulum]|uniref:Alanine racemase domain-containingprotein n=1 Tax=Purpureocillium lavendulum TaxID=1247861 RepID=A0AB34FKS1_9HYPO|nr:alanine racemase domain-containingprotein [Purpureocillium lavendulum]
MSLPDFYPPSPKDALAKLYVGKSIRDVPTPAAVLNVSAARRNCDRMLQACEQLNLGWRAHVKTHKTVELTRLQVGDDAKRPANLVASTLAEAEFLLPLLKEYRSQGRRVNLLYGLPFPKNAVSRFSAIAQALGEGSVSILLDDPAQLPIASQIKELSGVAPHAYIKVDMGGRRAGIPVDNGQFVSVTEAAIDAHGQGSIVLSGLYSHAGHSYGGDSRAAAIKMMNAELSALLDGADRVLSKAAEKGTQKLPSLILSAGASPTALSVQNLVSGKHSDDDITPELQAEVDSLTSLFDSIKGKGHDVEIHAGVYPTLDLQQLAAHSIKSSHLSWGDIAFTLLAEVHSIYPGRGADGTSEGLVGAGCIALGRETCKAYKGMAIPTPWGRDGVELPTCDVEDYTGWMVGWVSQEHGILQWRSGGNKEATEAEKKLEVGQKLRLWPNHACITGSHFGWYFVVDEDKGDEIVDIWVRTRAHSSPRQGDDGAAAAARPLRRGIYVPTVAFFDPDTDELDPKATARHATRLAGSGITGLAVQGSNGEAVHLLSHERSLVTKTTRAALDAAGYTHMPLLVGCGAQSTIETVALCRQAAADGGDYALVLPPSYYSGLFAAGNATVRDFFTAVADASPIPIIIYNYPGATPGIDINSDVLIELSRHSNIVGCKFTCGNTGKLGRVAAAVRAARRAAVGSSSDSEEEDGGSGADFLCFAGSADFTIASHAAGAAGVIGGLGNVAPRSCVRLFELCERGDAARDEADAVQETVARGDWVCIQTGVLGVKEALRAFYGYGGWARRPLPRPDAAARDGIVEGLRGLADLEKELEAKAAA